MTVCFVELESFTEELLQVADEETLRQFEVELAAKPGSRGADPAFWRVAESANEAVGTWKERRRAGHLPLVAGGPVFRPLHALHKVQTGEYPARIAGATTGCSGNH